MSRQNVELARRLFEEVWNQRRAEAIAELTAPEAVGHMEFGDMCCPEDFYPVHAEFLKAFPDLKVTVEDTISEGNKVAVRWSAMATHAGDAFGTKATHRPVHFHGVSWFVIRDGRIVEGWDSWNQGALMESLRR